MNTDTKNNDNLNVEEKIPLQTQADAILYFFQRLDVEMIALILEDHRTYQDFEKAKFINKLGDAFDEFIESGDTFLNRYPGICNWKTCIYKANGFSFISNVSLKYFNIIFDIKDGIVNDIYQCYDFKCQTDGIVRQGLVEIDKLELPF